MHLEGFDPLRRFIEPKLRWVFVGMVCCHVADQLHNDSMYIFLPLINRSSLTKQKKILCILIQNFELEMKMTLVSENFKLEITTAQECFFHS